MRYPEKSILGRGNSRCKALGQAQTWALRKSTHVEHSAVDLEVKRVDMAREFGFV